MVSPEQTLQQFDALIHGMAWQCLRRLPPSTTLTQEDLYQEGALHVWQKAGKYDARRAKMITFLTKILRNRFCKIVAMEWKRRGSVIPTRRLVPSQPTDLPPEFEKSEDAPNKPQEVEEEETLLHDVDEISSGQLMRDGVLDIEQIPVSPEQSLVEGLLDVERLAPDPTLIQRLLGVESSVLRSVLVEKDATRVFSILDRYPQLRREARLAAPKSAARTPRVPRKVEPPLSSDQLLKLPFAMVGWRPTFLCRETVFAIYAPRRTNPLAATTPDLSKAQKIPQQCWGSTPGVSLR